MVIEQYVQEQHLGVFVTKNIADTLDYLREQMSHMWTYTGSLQQLKASNEIKTIESIHLAASTTFSSLIGFRNSGQRPAR